MGLQRMYFPEDPRRADHRVGILRVEAVNSDLIGGTSDEKNVGVVWGLTDDYVVRLKPIGDANGERGPIHTGAFDGEDSGVLTSRQELALPVDYAMNKDVIAVEEYVGATIVETGLPPGRVNILGQYFLSE